MKRFLLLLVCLFFSSELKSLEITISCLWNEKVYYDQHKIKTKSQSLSEREFFYINTDFKFFGNPRNYGSLSDPDNDFNKNDIFEFKNEIFFKLSDLSVGKRKHYFTTEYNKKNGEIVDIFVNTNPNFGKIQSTEKRGFCQEVIFDDCANEKLLICLGYYSNINKVTKESIEYEKEKKYFFCKEKKFLSEYSFLIYQKTFPDLSDIYQFEEIKSDYIVKFYNSENYNYGYIKLNKYNLDISERIDLSRITNNFVGKCKITNLDNK
tara:strand:+ start:87 stop:881 length:795 start_codon:yes stop_codon:yes gene_type:complete